MPGPAPPRPGRLRRGARIAGPSVLVFVVFLVIQLAIGIWARSQLYATPNQTPTDVVVSRFDFPGGALYGRYAWRKVAGGMRYRVIGGPFDSGVWPTLPNAMVPPWVQEYFDESTTLPAHGQTWIAVNVEGIALGWPRPFVRVHTRCEYATRTTTFTPVDLPDRSPSRGVRTRVGRDLWVFQLLPINFAVSLATFAVPAAVLPLAQRRIVHHRRRRLGRCVQCGQPIDPVAEIDHRCPACRAP